MERPPFPQRIQDQVLASLAQDCLDLGWREGQNVRLEASVCPGAGVPGPGLAPGKVPAREHVADDEQVHVGGATGFAACRGAEKDDFFNAVCRTLQHGRQQLMHSPVDPGGTLCRCRFAWMARWRLRAGWRRFGVGSAMGCRLGVTDWMMPAPGVDLGECSFHCNMFSGALAQLGGTCRGLPITSECT